MHRRYHTVTGFNSCDCSIRGNYNLMLLETMRSSENPQNLFTARHFGDTGVVSGIGWQAALQRCRENIQE